MEGRSQGAATRKVRVCLCLGGGGGRGQGEKDVGKEAGRKLLDGADCRDILGENRSSQKGGALMGTASALLVLPEGTASTLLVIPEGEQQ